MKTRHKRSNTLSFVLLTIPALAVYTVFFAFSAFSGFFYSLTDWNGISPKYNMVGFQNYLKMFQDGQLLDALRFTLIYTLLLVLCILPISLMIALLLNSKIKAQGFFRSVYFFPAVLSLITVGLIFNEIFYQVVPQIGKAFNNETLSNNILGNSELAIYGILITNVWQGVAIPIVIFLAGLQSVPKDLYEAATIDGAGRFQQFKSITVPFLIPMLNVNLVMVIKSGLTVFDYIRAMTDGGPGTSTQSIGLLVFKNGFQQMKFGYGAAESIVLLLLAVTISVIQIKFLNKKEVGQL